MSEVKNYVFISDADYSEIIISACDSETAIHNLKDIAKHPSKYRLDTTINVTYSK